MKRLQARDNQPSLRHFLPPKPGKVNKIKQKISSITNSILSFFMEQYRGSEQSNPKYAGSGFLWENNQGQVEQQKNNKLDKSAKRAAKSSAIKFIKFRDVSSDEENDHQPTPQVLSNQKSDTKNGLIEQVSQSRENDNKINQLDKGKQKSASIQRKKAANKQDSNISGKIAEQNELQSQSYSQQQSSQSTYKENIRQRQKRVRLLTNQSYGKYQNNYKKYEASLDQSQDQDEMEMRIKNHLPRKRIKLINERQLGYIEDLNKKKWKAYKQTQNMLQNNKKKIYGMVFDQGFSSQQYNSQSFRSIARLKGKLQSIQNRRINLNRNISKSFGFQPIGDSLKYQKAKLNLQRVLETLRQPILKIRRKGQDSSLAGLFNENKITATQVNQLFGKSAFQSRFNIPEVNPKKINEQQKSTIQKQSQENKELNKVINFNLFSNPIIGNPKIQINNLKQKKIQQNSSVNIFMPSISLLKQNKDLPKQPFKPIIQSQNKQIKNSDQIIKLIKTDKVKPNTQGEAVQNKVIENKSQTKPIIDNPFLNKTTINTILLPELIANSKPLFGKTTTQPSIFDNIQPKKQQANNQFSTPTKNIYQKYPEIKPNTSGNPIVSIPQSQEEDSSMFDESQYSASKKQDVVYSPLRVNSIFSVANNSGNSFLGTNNSAISNLGVQNFATQPQGAFDRQNFFNTIPQVDVVKSVQMFGAFGSNDNSNSDSLWGNPSGDPSKKAATTKNKKKQKQQRAYA